VVVIALFVVLDALKSGSDTPPNLQAARALCTLSFTRPYLLWCHCT
jgi:hypothetical protein